MTERPLKNRAASVHQRLLNLSKTQGRPFNEVLQYYAMERFLYRLVQSGHGDRFILKGALMLSVWKVSVSRPTMDIDLLGHMENDIEAVCAVARRACAQTVEPDGLAFDPESVAGERIAEDADYSGVRFRVNGTLGNARLAVQVDVGFGDAVFPRPVLVEYPTLLRLPAPVLRAYTRESTVAEKFCAMVALDLLNSRMKDFFDIALLCREFDFDGTTLAEAVTRTFERRRMSVPASPVSFSPDFAARPDKQAQWRAFVRRTHLAGVPLDFGDTVRVVREFLQPVAESLAARQPFNRTWPPAGPWR